MSVQTRQDLHSRHAREQEALQAQIATLQKATAVTSIPDVLQRQALMEVSRLKQENEGLQERLAAADTSAGHAETIDELQARPLRCALCAVCCVAVNSRNVFRCLCPERKCRGVCVWHGKRRQGGWR